MKTPSVSLFRHFASAYPFNRPFMAGVIGGLVVQLHSHHLTHMADRLGDELSPCIAADRRQRRAGH